MPEEHPKTWTHAETVSAGRPLTEEIARDHETLRQCYENYKKATTDDEKQEWVNQYVWTNARHAIAEEIVVYPIMDDLMGEEAKEITEKDRDSHQRIKEDLYAFQSKAVTDSDHADAFKQVFESLWQHVIPEETEDLPAFEKYLSEERSLEIAKQFRRSQYFTPTRSHPSAPRYTPYETAAGLMAAPIDKLMDLFRSFPSEEMMEEKITTGANQPTHVYGE
ncbi:hypothetical protein P389DRAFT_197211 [Cystobasidium minutum MCA 4210]|uniref:uncharacterized protein n=1 Tax=Cystobasidium minutum MCA 4210 TaxID=1397322 RepID=UPI0034CDBCC1|eukprot:jgi/Rhomi1/197211/gm1.5425_g